MIPANDEWVINNRKSTAVEFPERLLTKPQFSSICKINIGTACQHLPHIYHRTGVFLCLCSWPPTCFWSGSSCHIRHLSKTLFCLHFTRYLFSWTERSSLWLFTRHIFSCTNLRHSRYLCLCLYFHTLNILISNLYSHEFLNSYLRLRVSIIFSFSIQNVFKSVILI